MSNPSDDDSPLARLEEASLALIEELEQVIDKLRNHPHRTEKNLAQEGHLAMARYHQARGMFLACSIVAGDDEPDGTRYAVDNFGIDPREYASQIAVAKDEARQALRERGENPKYGLTRAQLHSIFQAATPK